MSWNRTKMIVCGEEKEKEKVMCKGSIVIFPSKPESNWRETNLVGLGGGGGPIIFPSKPNIGKHQFSTNFFILLIFT